MTHSVQRRTEGCVDAAVAEFVFYLTLAHVCPSKKSLLNRLRVVRLSSYGELKQMFL